MIIKEKNSPKIFKIFKIFKKREKAKSKAKSKAMALASLVSFQEQNQKQEWIRFAHRAIFARFARSRGKYHVVALLG